MKTKIYFLLLILFPGIQYNANSQGVSINEDGAEPDSSALLDLQSTSKGLLVPRMAQYQITDIQDPANGLIVFNTTDNKYYAYLETENAWKEISYGTNSMTPFVCGSDLYDYRDGQSYSTKQYGNRCWMTENLNIGTMTTAYNQSNDGNIEKYCMYNNTANCDEYGGLYQWNEAMQYTTQQGAQGICPDGWHIPTNMEWFLFQNLIDPTITNPTSIGQQGGNYSGGWLKEAGYTHWYSPNTYATNASEFTALGSGFRYGSGSYSFKQEGDFWSSTQYSSTQAYDMELYYNNPFIYRRVPNKVHGLGVRCIKDE